MIQRKIIFIIDETATAVPNSLPTINIQGDNINSDFIYLITPYDGVDFRCNINVARAIGSNIFQVAMFQTNETTSDLVRETEIYYEQIKNWKVYSGRVPFAVTIQAARYGTTSAGISFKSRITAENTIISFNTETYSIGINAVIGSGDLEDISPSITDDILIKLSNLAGDIEYLQLREAETIAALNDISESLSNALDIIFDMQIEISNLQKISVVFSQTQPENMSEDILWITRNGKLLETYINILGDITTGFYRSDIYHVNGLLSNDTINNSLLPRAKYYDLGAVYTTDEYHYVPGLEDVESIALNVIGAYNMYQEIINKMSAISSPLIFLGSADVDWSVGMTQEQINNYMYNYIIGELGGGHEWIVPGAALILYNMSNNPYIQASEISSVMWSTGGFWLWIYDKNNNWIASMDFPNIPKADWYGTTLSSMVEGIITKDMLWKLKNIESGAQVNKIETIRKNGVVQSIDNKTVDISVGAGTLILQQNNKTVGSTFNADSSSSVIYNIVAPDWNIQGDLEAGYIKNKPTVFPPTNHTHDAGTITKSTTLDIKGASALNQALFNTARANRLAFMSSKCVTIEQSINGGITWTNYYLSDLQKINVFNGIGEPLFLPESTFNSQTRLRITINVFDDPERRIYFSDWANTYIYVSTNGVSGMYVDMEKNYTINPNTWVLVRSGIPLAGWSGPNDIMHSSIILGGLESSEYHTSKVRFTFGIKTAGGIQNAYVSQIRAYGAIAYESPSYLAGHDHLYTWDALQNALFPASISANGTLKAYEIREGDVRVYSPNNPPPGGGGIADLIQTSEAATRTQFQVIPWDGNVMASLIDYSYSGDTNRWMINFAQGSGYFPHYTMGYDNSTSSFFMERLGTRVFDSNNQGGMVQIYDFNSEEANPTYSENPFSTRSGNGRLTPAIQEYSAIMVMWTVGGWEPVYYNTIVPLVLNEWTHNSTLRSGKSGMTPYEYGDADIPITVDLNEGYIHTVCYMTNNRLFISFCDNNGREVLPGYYSDISVRVQKVWAMKSRVIPT